MTGSVAWSEWPKGVRRIRRRRSSTAKASSRPTSVAPAVSTRERKVKGRKRHVLVDMLGLILVVLVTPASVQDRDGAVPVLREAHREYPTLSKPWVDGAYTGQVIEDLRTETSNDIERVKRTDDIKGFVVVPRRWIGERTNGWFGKFRILSKEYERTIQSSTSDILHAMSMLMLRRLTVPAALRKERR
jgi:putative transposase